MQGLLIAVCATSARSSSDQHDNECPWAILLARMSEFLFHQCLQDGAVEMTNRRRLLVLCADNLLRSPLAYGVLRQYHKFEVVAAGFECEHSVGLMLPDITIRSASEIGINLSEYRVSEFDICLVDWAEEFIVLDAYTRALLRNELERFRYLPIPRRRLHILGQYCNPPVSSILSAIHYPLDNDDIEQVIDQVIMGSHKLARTLLGKEKAS